jgi:SLT domain-containing protein
MAATKAFATFGGWPFGAIAAAATIAMGMAQVATIRSQQYSGRQLGGPVMGGQSYVVGENGPEIFTPNSTGSITPNGKLGDTPPTQVVFNINANDTRGFDELLSARRGLITQIIRDAQSERGQKVNY